jgi:hypothetical protein
LIKSLKSLRRKREFKRCCRIELGHSGDFLSEWERVEKAGDSEIVKGFRGESREAMQLRKELEQM